MLTDVETLVKQRRLAYERSEESAAKLIQRLVDAMDAQWKLFLAVDLDPPAVIPGKVKDFLAESKGNSRIQPKNKENRAIKYVWDMLRVYFDVFQMKQFKITKEGTSLKELEQHLVTTLNKLPAGFVLPTEPVCKALSSGTLKSLGTLTPQAAAGTAFRAVRMQQAHQLARERAIAALHERRRLAAAPRQQRLRERRTGARPVCPAIDNALAGKAMEMGFLIERDLDHEEHVKVGKRIQKKFDGMVYNGAVTSFEHDLFHIEYEDGDEEDLTEEELDQIVFPREPRLETWSSVSYCYGEIRDAKIVKNKVGRKTVTSALLYVRWDEKVYDEENEQSLEWVNVIPGNYGASGKDGWELVDVRIPEVQAAPLEPPFDLESEGGLTDDEGDSGSGDGNGSSSGSESENGGRGGDGGPAAKRGRR